MELPYDVWTEVTTTETDVLFQAPRGRVKITTLDPTGSVFEEADNTIEITDNTQINGLFIVPPGMTVWAKPVAFPNVSSPPTICWTPWGA